MAEHYFALTKEDQGEVLEQARAKMGRPTHFQEAVDGRTVAWAVAQHKSHLFSEKDTEGKIIDYIAAVEGGLQIVPDGAAGDALATDYAEMLKDQIMVGDALPFDELLKACAEIARQANGPAKPLEEQARWSDPERATPWRSSLNCRSLSSRS